MSRTLLGKKHRPRGFTLIELLVAILVFAVMAAMAYGGLAAVMRSRQGLEDALQRNAKLQKAIYRLRGDLYDVRARTIRGRYGDVKPAFVATASGVVSFTRGGYPNPLHQRRATLQRVSYRLDGEKLERARWLVLDRSPDSAPERTTLLTGIKRLRWRFTDADGQTFSQWPPPNKPTTGAHPPPVSAEIILKTKHWGDLRLLVALTAPDHQAPAARPAKTGNPNEK